MNNQENEREEMDTTSIPEDTSSVLDETTGDFGDSSGVLEDTNGVLDDTTRTVDDIQLDELICHLSDQDLLQDTPPGSPLVPQPTASILEELERTPPPFSFLNASTLPHRAPLIPEIVEQPQLS